MLGNVTAAVGVDRSPSKEFVAASAVPLILSLLSRADSYGYELIREVRELSGGELRWADGMLYPILHRLEKRGLIESYWGVGDAGRKRRYYRIRQAGSSELAALRAQWHQMGSLLRRLEGGETDV